MNRLIEVIARLGLFASLAIALVSLPALPELIPIHFNLAGEPDNWGPRWMILLLPAISAALFAMLRFFARLDTRWYNFPRALTAAGQQRQVTLIRRLLRMLGLEITWVFAALTLEVVLVAHGREPIGPILLIASLGIMAITIVVFVLRVLTVR